MRCLIAFRTNRDENLVTNSNYAKCDAAIEQWQKTAGEDVRFSPKFWKNCKRDIKRNGCNTRGNSKREVVGCLAKILVKDANDDAAAGDVATEDNQVVQQGRVSPQCQNEVKFQLMQMHSDVNLNPRIQRQCQRELAGNECGDVAGGSGKKLECLKGLPHGAVSEGCRSALFQEEREEAVFNKVDTYLMTTCKKEIKHFCREADKAPNTILNCLKLAKDDPLFGQKCRQIVRKRIIQQSSDYRLNPALQVACAKDLNQHCSHVIQQDNVRRVKVAITIT